MVSLVFMFDQVNTKAAGKSAMHCAAAGGHLNVMKCLLEFSPNLEIQVSACNSHVTVT